VSFDKHTLIQPFGAPSQTEILRADDSANCESLSVLLSDVDALPPGGSREQRYLSVCARATLNDLTLKLNGGVEAQEAWLAHDPSRTQALEDGRLADEKVVEDLFKLGLWEKRTLGTSEVVDRMAGLDDTLARIGGIVRIHDAIRRADSVVTAEMVRLP